MTPDEIRYWFCAGYIAAYALKLGHRDEFDKIRDEYLAATNPTQPGG